MPLKPGRFDWKREIRDSSLAAVWMALLTGPLMVVKINTSDYSLSLRWPLRPFGRVAPATGQTRFGAARRPTRRT